MKPIQKAFILVFGSVLILLAARAYPDEKLSPAHSLWLEDVSPIITKTERDVFLKLRNEAEREKFIRFFWRQRDPLPDTTVNEFYKEYMERIRFADRYFGIGSSKRGSQTERGFFYVSLGKPLERNIYATFSEIWPLELWFYQGDQQYGLPAYFYLVFYQPEGIGDYRLYYPGIEGPEKLVIPGVSSQSVTRASAHSVLKKINAELAAASLSYLPGDSPYGSEAFSSDNIIGSIRALPEKKYSDAYARSYANYKDRVETEYADNFIGAGSKVRLFRVSGQPFLEWSIEPDKMSFAQRDDGFYASFEIVIRMEDATGRLLLEKTEEIPVHVTAGQYKANERRRFAFQDALPVIPGGHRVLFLLKNKTSREFTSFETKIAVPIRANGDLLSSLLLFHRRESLADAQRWNVKPFAFDGVQYIVSAKNEFNPGESLGVYIQSGRDSGVAGDPGAEIRLVVTALDGETVIREQKVLLADIAKRSGEGIEFEPLTLGDVKPGYYRAEASLVSRGKILATERDNFILLAQAYPVLPWVYAKVQPPFPSLEHLRTLGTQRFMTGDYDGAADTLRRALREKDDPGVRLLLSKCLFAREKFRESLAEAIPVYEATKDREAAKVIALDHAGLKDWAAALTYLETLMAEATEISVLNLAAECHMNLKQPDKALPLIVRSLSLDPSQPRIREMEERARREAGRLQ
jgi:GWxTD domain-containing protein